MGVIGACTEMIVALDVPAIEPAVELVRGLGGVAGAFKVGLELFNAAGPEVFHAVRQAGADRIFYDAKLCDIPNTVAGAVRAATRHGLWLINVHALGGLAMMRAAKEAAQEGAAAAGCRPPRVIAVTLVTSLGDAEARDELGLRGPASAEVRRLAALARSAGLDGVVSSPREAAAIRSECGPDFLIVTPGIRPAAGPAVGLTQRSAPDDQRRVTTPGEAIRAGADYLVLGRPITAAADPRRAAEALASEIAAARSGRP